MDERDWLAERLHEHRPRLRAVVYRMLGSTSEADDAVREAWIRLSRSNAGEIDNLEAWLVTAVGRVALNMLRSRRTRREEPLVAHLPDPIVDRADGIDPSRRARDIDTGRAARLRPPRNSPAADAAASAVRTRPRCRRDRTASGR
jgi:DNA-directed RNA polymerase specialized sigma24 family protein